MRLEADDGTEGEEAARDGSSSAATDQWHDRACVSTLRQQDTDIQVHAHSLAEERTLGSIPGIGLMPDEETYMKEPVASLVCSSIALLWYPPPLVATKSRPESPSTSPKVEVRQKKFDR